MVGNRQQCVFEISVFWEKEKDDRKKKKLAGLNFLIGANL